MVNFLGCTKNKIYYPSLTLYKFPHCFRLNWEILGINYIPYGKMYSFLYIYIVFLVMITNRFSFHFQHFKKSLFVASVVKINQIKVCLSNWTLWMTFTWKKFYTYYSFSYLHTSHAIFGLFILHKLENDIWMRIFAATYAHCRNLHSSQGTASSFHVSCRHLVISFPEILDVSEIIVWCCTLFL